MRVASSARDALNRHLLPDWRQDAAYLPLIGADRSVFAWEWLRRTAAYRAIWDSRQRNRPRAEAAYRFGLEDLEDPSIGAPQARPVWSRQVLPNVLTAHVEDIAVAGSDRIDLRLLAPFVTIVIGPNETEHLLFSDGRRFLRIDVVEGTLIGCPSSLTYLLRGLTRLSGPIASLNRLARLVREGNFESEPSPMALRHHRWVQELRVADALTSGCDQQAIARSLFGPLVAESRWRTESPSIRRQIQRLVAAARMRMRRPLEFWFDAV